VTVRRDKFLSWNKLYALIPQIYFWNKTLHVSDSSCVHHQEFFTVHTTMVYVIQVCWQLASRIKMVPSWSWSWWWTEELSETCRVLFQNKFEKLVHLVGFIIRTVEAVKEILPMKSATIWTDGKRARSPYVRGFSTKICVTCSGTICTPRYANVLDTNS